MIIENLFDLENLNKEQREAVETLDKPLLILAGAGSGKTRTIISRIVNILDKGKAWPSQILAITFTNKAAREMKERIDSYNIPGTESMWVSTIHSACAKILRINAERLNYTNNFKVLDSHDQSVVIRKILKDFNIDSKKYKPGIFSNYISSFKNKGIEFSDLRKEEIGYPDRQKFKVFGEYSKRLKAMDAMDFDDSATRFQMKSLDTSSELVI